MTEQIELIDVQPQNAKEIERAAYAYIEAKECTADAREQEHVKRDKLVEVVRSAGIAPNPDGAYRFRACGTVITVTPVPEKITVKFRVGDVWTLDSGVQLHVHSFGDSDCDGDVDLIDFGVFQVDGDPCDWSAWFANRTKPNEAAVKWSGE